MTNDLLARLKAKGAVKPPTRSTKPREPMILRAVYVGGRGEHYIVEEFTSDGGSWVTLYDDDGSIEKRHLPFRTWETAPRRIA